MAITITTLTLTLTLSEPEMDITMRIESCARCVPIELLSIPGLQGEQPGLDE